jgi:hypothetical protein
MPLAAIVADHPDAYLPADDLARRIAMECPHATHEEPQQV